MEFFVILGFLLFIGAVMGWTNFFKIRGLEEQLRKLKNELESLQKTQSKDADIFAELRKDEAEIEANRLRVSKSDEIAEPTFESPESSEEPVTEPLSESNSQPDTDSEPQPEQTKQPKDEDDWQPNPVIAVDYVEVFYQKFKENWMLWIGGLSISLAVIFLARYAIQHGMFGPTARIISGILTGISLHIAAEYLRRKLNQNHPTFAMLAAGGSIGLFATLLAALHFYNMFSPMVIFIVLAIVALVTIWLSLVHGPILAAVGMLGAYVLPLLVSTGSGNINVALLYSLIITSSVLILLGQVKQTWLWYGMVTGSLMWWLFSLDYNAADVSRQWYLALLAYLYMSVVKQDWTLAKSPSLEGDLNWRELVNPSIKRADKLPILTSYALVVAGLISFADTGVTLSGIPTWIPLAVVMLFVARNNALMTLHVWLLAIGLVSTLLVLNLSSHSEMLINPISELYQSNFLTNIVLFVIIFSGFGLRNALNGQQVTGWPALTLLSPLFALVLSYLVVPSLLSNNFWTLTAMLFGAVYIFLGSTSKARNWLTDWQIWFYLCGHFAYSFAATVFFAEGTLTLALALQTISLAIIIKRYDILQLSWLIKVVTTVTVIRLSANPWLLDYSTEVHWTLWTYGGSFLAILYASFVMAESKKLRMWLEGAAMHLFVLTLWVELRYFLYDGAAFSNEFTFTEASLLIVLSGALSLVYYHRASLSDHTKSLYQYYSYFLMTVSIGMYALILIETLTNSASVRDNIGSTPIFNMMLITYGFPALLSLLAMKYYEPKFKAYFEYLSALTTFVFINLEIRHLWQGNLNLNNATSNGEFYTYSIVWLLAALAVIFVSTYKLGYRYYKIGLTMLALVVFKVFFFDMSQLDGIYRIISFMILGFVLLGMAYVHKRLVFIIESKDGANTRPSTS